MKKLLLTTAIAFAFSAPAFAGGSHTGGHDDHHTETNEMKIGMPGDPAKVSRTIEVTMRENDNGDMLFEPTKFDITKGETIRFSVVNKGEIEHEFVIDTIEGNSEHKALMAKIDMEHDDPNSIRLDPGQTGEIIWNFANQGTFELACLIPGHYESGMHGPIEVVEKLAMAHTQYTLGQIKKIDAKSGKVTIVHGPLVTLDMPAMTMVFRADKAMIERMSVGQDIEFVADRVNGKLTVVDMK